MSWRWIVLLVWVFACDSSRPHRGGDSGRHDTGPEERDTGSADAGAPDAGKTPDDGGPMDSGRRDAAPIPETDAGIWDPGPPCPGGCDGGVCCRAAAGWACAAVADESACPLPDLTVHPDRLLSDVSFGWEEFTGADCEVANRCVGGPGWRRLMRFDTQTPNIGTGDLRIGVPGPSNPVFTRNECSGTYLFDTYARYTLLDADGTAVARGAKQAFCIMDTDRWFDEPGVPLRGTYDCRNQGITRGWSDVYHGGLSCQWIDVTDVAPGDYTLRVQLNVDRRVAELDYANDLVEVPLTVPADESTDPLAACSSGGTGPARDCGWMLAGTFTCTPGAAGTAQCRTGCDAAACTGDPMIRVCAGDLACTSREALASDDDCRMGVYCPVSAFTCPPGGRVTILTAPYTAGGSYACEVGVR